MKKLISLTLALMLVFSLATVAMAADAQTMNFTTESTTYQAVIKAYTVSGNTVDTLYPAETLKFTSKPDDGNPDQTNLTIGDLPVSGNSNQKLTINVPSYTKVGTYHYTISETAGSTQGVAYTTNTIAVSVLVTYDYEDSDNDEHNLTATVGITSIGNTKTSTFTNTYDVGSLSVTKNVTGNLGDTNKYFDVTVTFTAETGKTVASAITISGGSYSTNPTTIASNWTGMKSVDLKLKDGDTITFNNIPAGVMYTVTESDEYSKDTNKNGVNGYDVPSYTFSDDNKTIAKGDSDTATITNNKNVDVDTGITLDSLPFVLILAVCAGAVVLFVIKRRNSVEF